MQTKHKVALVLLAFTFATFTYVNVFQPQPRDENVAARRVRSIDTARYSLGAVFHGLEL